MDGKLVSRPRPSSLSHVTQISTVYLNHCTVPAPWLERISTFNQIRNARPYDQGRRDNQFKIGDTVVCRKFMRKPGLSPKLTLHYYYGPYQIIYMPTEVNAIIEAKGTGGNVIKE
jgi:hypothetical protein